VQKYQSITKTASCGPERTLLIDEERQHFGLASFLLEAGEDSDQQLEWVLGHLADKPTELERYVYLIRLCDRNERLFYKILMSNRIPFLLATDCRRRLHDIWLHLRSVPRHPTFRSLPSHEHRGFTIKQNRARSNTDKRASSTYATLEARSAYRRALYRILHRQNDNITIKAHVRIAV
jgi:hypothetical protein